MIWSDDAKDMVFGEEQLYSWLLNKVMALLWQNLDFYFNSIQLLQEIWSEYKVLSIE